MAKKSEGSGIQQAAGLIRYFDEESEESMKISPFQVYFACFVIGGFFYLVNEGVVQAIMDLFAREQSYLFKAKTFRTDSS